MQSARGGVGTAAELTAGVQFGEHHLNTRETGAGFLVNGNTAAVVVDLHATVLVQDHGNVLPVARQRLIHRVVDDFPHAVHEPARVGGTDVHARTLAHRFEALQNGKVPGIVFGTSGCHGAESPGCLACERGWDSPTLDRGTDIVRGGRNRCSRGSNRVYLWFY